MRPLIDDMHAYDFNRTSSTRTRSCRLKRNIYVHPVPRGGHGRADRRDRCRQRRVRVRLPPAHPEGMADPISFVDELEGWPRRTRPR
ncbi:MAG: hypothetical protein R2711_17210 [Acidimicrobiales bacterium]